MTTASEHARRYPNCRSATLAHLIAKERTTDQLRREVAAKRNPLLRVWFALRSHLKGA